MKTETYEQQAAQVIMTNRYLSMATSSSNTPWCAPLAYVLSPDFEFIFYSATASRHVQNFTANNAVACTIFNSTLGSDDADGIQFSGSVREISANDLRIVMELYFRVSFPDPEIRSKWMRPIQDFCNDAPQRFYAIKPIEMFKPDPTSPKIDKRLKLDISAVKIALFK